MQNDSPWKDPDIARYLLTNKEYSRWRIDAGGSVLWVNSEGTEVINADDLGDRREAVKRFISSRGSVSRKELEEEFKDDRDQTYECDVFSIMTGPIDISAVEQVLKKEFPAARVSIYTSGYSGARTIHVQSDDVDFEGYPENTDGNGADSDYFFNGAIEATVEVAVAKAQQLFSSLVEAGIRVTYEVYDPHGTTLFEHSVAS